MRQITAAIAERNYYSDKRNRSYVSWSVSTLAKVVASTIQTDKPEGVTKYMEQLNELAIETPAEIKFKETAPVNNVMGAGSAEKLMSMFGADVTVEIDIDADEGMKVMANYAGVEYFDEDGPQPL